MGIVSTFATPKQTLVIPSPVRPASKQVQREILPQPGDTFTVLEKWIDLDPNGAVKEMARQEGGSLTFGDQMFTWEELDAAPEQ